MSGETSPSEIPLLDVKSKDPNIPRVVTIRECSEQAGHYERVVTFPDGSAQTEFFFREGYGDAFRAPAVADHSGNADAAIGRDAAAQLLAERFVGQLIYCHAAKSWFVWDGTIWRRDRNYGVPRMIRAALREAGVDDPAPTLVAGVERYARSEEALTASAAGDNTDVWDPDPWRLGTPGGTVDLTTGALHPADPVDRITRATAVAPAETSDCPLWRRFLDEAMGGDQALATFLQRFLGYALTGETSEHALLCGIGEGGNGKSVFVNTIRGIFGDYAAVATPDLLTQGAERRAGQPHSTEIAMLAGARLVTASETEEGRVWADGRLKLLTGGDPVTARRIGRDPVTFTPRFKLLVVGNHMPVLRTVDAAIRRRLCIVPFATRPAVPDRTLEARLKAEWPAILRWMVEGGLAWRAEGADGGLQRPAAVATATDAYLASQDLVGQFLAEWCEMGTPRYLEAAADLYGAWCVFAKFVGEQPGTQRRFAARLERHGLIRERVNHARLYRGIRLMRRGERDGEMHEVRQAAR